MTVAPRSLIRAAATRDLHARVLHQRQLRLQVGGLVIGLGLLKAGVVFDVTIGPRI